MCSWSRTSLVWAGNGCWAMRRFGEIMSMCVAVGYHYYQKYLYTQSWLGHRVAGLLKDMFPHLLSKVGFSNKRVLGFKSMLWWGNPSIGLDPGVNSYAYGGCMWLGECRSGSFRAMPQWWWSPSLVVSLVFDLNPTLWTLCSRVWDHKLR